MKKLFLITIGFLLGVSALIYKISVTPYGRMHPYMAVIQKLMATFPIWNVASGDLEKIRVQMNKKPRTTIAVARVEDVVIPARPENLQMRLYTPAGSGPFPTIVFYHGGGFVTGSIESHDNLARQLARDTESIVISVEYRLAPEHPFPASLEDAYAGLLWAAEHAPRFNGRVDQLCVAGDSAGGNLAAAVSLLAREENGPVISLQILLYPSTTMVDRKLESRQLFAKDLLTKKTGYFIRDAYVPNEVDWTNPYASPLEAENLGNLPPAYVMTAAFDPLRDEGKLFADALAQAGVPVVYRNMAGMIHGFLTLADIVTLVPGAITFYPQPGQVYADIRQMMQQYLIMTPQP